MEQQLSRFMERHFGGGWQQPLNPHAGPGSDTRGISGGDAVLI